MASLTALDVLLGDLQLVVGADVPDHYQHGEVSVDSAAVSVHLFAFILLYRGERISDPSPHGNGTWRRRRAGVNLHDNCRCRKLRVQSYEQEATGEGTGTRTEGSGLRLPDRPPE